MNIKKTFEIQVHAQRIVCIILGQLAGYVQPCPCTHVWEHTFTALSKKKVMSKGYLIYMSDSFLLCSSTNFVGYSYKYIRCEGTSNNSRCSSVDFQESNPLTGVFHTNNMDNASGWSGRPSGILSSFRKFAANITSKNSKTAGKMVKCWLIISPVLIFSSNSVSWISSTGPNAALAPCVDTCRPVAEAVYQFSSCVLGLFWTHDIGKYDLFLLQSMKKGQSNSNPVISHAQATINLFILFMLLLRKFKETFQKLSFYYKTIEI